MTLATGIVERALRPSPPVYYTVGGKSWTFWVLERLPRSFVWMLLSRIMGIANVKPTTGEEVKTK